MHKHTSERVRAHTQRERERETLIHISMTAPLDLFTFGRYNLAAIYKCEEKWDKKQAHHDSIFRIHNATLQHRRFSIIMQQPFQE